MLFNEPVVFLLLILVTVIVVGQVSVGAFSSTIYEGIDAPAPAPAPAPSTAPAQAPAGSNAQDKLTGATVGLAVGPNQSSVDSPFDNLQLRCNNIKQRIDVINQKIPRSSTDIRVKSVAYVPWEAKESSMIQIDRVPYQFAPAVGSGMDCSCNYGCKWDIVLTLPIGPSGKKGPQGVVGPQGDAGKQGQQGPPGPRGDWAST